MTASFGRLKTRDTLVSLAIDAILEFGYQGEFLVREGSSALAIQLIFQFQNVNRKPFHSTEWRDRFISFAEKRMNKSGRYRFLRSLPDARLARFTHCRREICCWRLRRFLNKIKVLDGFLSLNLVFHWILHIPNCKSEVNPLHEVKETPTHITPL